MQIAAVHFVALIEDITELFEILSNSITKEKAWTSKEMDNSISQGKIDRERNKSIMLVYAAPILLQVPVIIHFLMYLTCFSKLWGVFDTSPGLKNVSAG